MKTKLLGIASLLAFSAAANGAIALTGTALSGLGALAPVGTLVLLTVDNTGNGTLGVPSLSGELASNSVPPLLIADASITTGETFGGDLVLGRASVTSAGALPGGFSFENVAGIQNRRFSLIFLPSLTAASTNANVNGSTTYGVISGTDWVLPAVNGGESFSFSATDSLGSGSFFRVTVSAGVAANEQFASAGGANLTLVPEPSAALLGAIGALGLLRRRRA
jgi:hypothetical protein